MDSSMTRDVDFFDLYEQPQQRSQLRTSNSDLFTYSFDYFTSSEDPNEPIWEINSNESLPTFYCSPPDVVPFEKSLFSASAPDNSPRFEDFYAKDINSPTHDEEDEDLEPDDASERSVTEMAEPETHIDECSKELTSETRPSSENQNLHNILPASKTPCLDATAYCAELRLGAERDPNHCDLIIVTNFSSFMQHMKTFCPKNHPTQNEEARIKALRRWFEGIPNKKNRQSRFVMKMKPEKKHKILSCFKKVRKYITQTYTSNSQSLATTPTRDSCKCNDNPSSC